MLSGDKIRSQSCPVCHVCGSEGACLYQRLRDRLFDAPGEWNIRQCTNPNCGLLWLDPMPIAEDIGKAYESYYTHEQGSAGLTARYLYERFKRAYSASRYGLDAPDISWVERTFARIAALFLFARRDDIEYGFAQFSGMPKGRLLEIGCGSGDSLRAFADWGWQVEGVDFDPLAVKNARSKGLLVQQGDLFSQQYPDNNFDAIFTSHVIEHVPDPKAFLMECKRVMRVGGRMVIVTPNAHSRLHRLFKECWRGLEPPRHLHVFTPVALEQIAKTVGMSSYQLTTSAHGAGGIFRSSRKIRAERKLVMQGKDSFVERLEGEMVYWWEWLLLWTNPTIGEEIIFVATKR